MSCNSNSACDAHEPDQYDCSPSTSVVSTFKQKLLPKLFICKIVLINLWLLYAVFDELPASGQFKTSTLSNLNHKLRP